MTSDLWTALHCWPGAAAGVTARGPHDPAGAPSGYNMGHTDQADHEAVERLRRRAVQELLACRSDAAPAQLVMAEQVHGNKVAVVRHEELPDLPRRHGHAYYPGCDALIAAEPGLALMLFYADCCPVILYSPTAQCGGVAHAGWRGAVADIAGETVRALQSEFGAEPNDMHAIVGPCIGVECYEVGPEVAAAVVALELDCCLRKTKMAAASDRCQLDLLALNVALLQRAGLAPENIRPIPHCTRCGPVPLFSWRRDGPATGRMAALFTLFD